MNQKNEIPCWMALAHIPEWNTDKKNKLIVDIVHNHKSGLEEFLNSPDGWGQDYGLSDEEIAVIEAARQELPNYSFLAESMLNQGFEILTLNSEDYPPMMKENLKMSQSPPVIYIKGNKKLLKEKAIAIVGSRDASQAALDFSDNIALNASKEFKVVVSGFARGVDKQSLDSSIKYSGQSIIVLPQGILTFGAGIKQYYNGIVKGDILVLSTFHPKMPWSVQAAMQRNVFIYGLAGEIFVAESKESGGTWAGVKDGLRKGRKIYVRMPGEGEDNANMLLMEEGARPVDFHGKEIEYHSRKEAESDIIDNKIMELLNKGAEMTSKQIIETLSIDWNAQKLTNYLKKKEEIETTKSRPVKFKLRNSKAQEALF